MQTITGDRSLGDVLASSLPPNRPIAPDGGGGDEAPAEDDEEEAEPT
jgi:hypothetical protein